MTGADTGAKTVRQLAADVFRAVEALEHEIANWRQSLANRGKESPDGKESE